MSLIRAFISSLSMFSADGGEPSLQVLSEPQYSPAPHPTVALQPHESPIVVCRHTLEAHSLFCAQAAPYAALLVAVLHCPVAVLHVFPVPQLAVVLQRSHSLPNSVTEPQNPLWHCEFAVHG